MTSPVHSRKEVETSTPHSTEESCVRYVMPNYFVTETGNVLLHFKYVSTDRNVHVRTHRQT